MPKTLSKSRHQTNIIMPTLHTPLPIEQHDLKLDTLFSHLQGNILKGHGRPHTANIFIKFTASANNVKNWLSNYASQITSTKQQLKENKLFKERGIEGGLFSTVSISATGLKYLGLDINIPALEQSFKNGMKKAHIHDPLPSAWEQPFQQEADALILLAYHDEVVLNEAADNLRADIAGIADVLTTEEGHALRNKNGDGIEHFGYMDGASQPLFFKDELETFDKDNLPLSGFNPLAVKNLKQVLIADPFVTGSDTPDIDAYGSFLVFRKLEQNVKGFKLAEEVLATQLGLLGEDAERAGAMIVGRFEDGSPVTLSDEDGMIGSGTLNAFNYSNDYRGDGKTDTNGSKCPFHAHIRKVNPRDGSEGIHVMGRRGIPYGKREDESFENIDMMPEEGVGLLFQSYQSSITDQFEFLQETWANNKNFPIPTAGLDPIIGQSEEKKSTGQFAAIWGDAGSFKTAEFSQFVTMKGGEYFFTPSIPFFNFIKNTSK